MDRGKIVIRGAREHNLKDIDLELPRGKLIVFTGVSGSGKSSLAFDTIYAEGQRRYVESLSSYARQFLGRMDKPDVDFIEGLSPAVSIDQKSTSHNPRSTVGTVTEIYDYLRLLYARVGRPHCPRCGRPIERQTREQMVERILTLPRGTRLQILAPVVRGRKGEYEALLAELGRKGFSRAKVDGEVVDLSEKIRLEKYKKHTIQVVVDRLVLKEGVEGRLSEAVETALELAGGLVEVEQVDRGETTLFSRNYACPECGVQLEELQPRNFSFNSPYGACPRCAGLGSKLEVDPELVVPDASLSLQEGAVAPWAGARVEYFDRLLEAVAEAHGFSTRTPWKVLDEEARRVVLWGSEEPVFVQYRSRYGHRRAYWTRYEGVIPWLERKLEEAESDWSRDKIAQYMREVPCSACGGARLRPESLAVTVGGLNIWELSRLTVRQVEAFLSRLELSEKESAIAAPILKEIKARLRFLADVGLDYLTLDRSAATLAGGEAQRIRLATQIGSGLVGVLYVLDEPSIGLHQRDNHKLISTLLRLRDLGNTLIVVEHDEATIRAADWVVDIGPGAGEKGGEIVVAGTVEEVERHPTSLTGAYLSGRRRIEIPARRRRPGERWLVIKGARQNNLKGVDVRIPLGVFTCVTGVSGSGKSSLINDTLYPALMNRVYRSRLPEGKHDGLEGVEHLDKVVNVDQSPIGRTPRSNPATYTGVFDHIRALFAQTPEARARGYRPGRFSFNVRGGRCEACTGEGQIKIEMHFLPDVYVTCEVCKGTRYARETLEVKFKGKSIADVLAMSVEEALEFFGAIPTIRRHLETLADVGLGYIRLGQPAPTLSGGEAQRVKLAAELSRRPTGRTLYLLDEPTTGLHFEDVRKLLAVLNRLVEGGNTVVVIEHNLEVIKAADWIVDLGPEGGDEGGWVVAEGPPEEVARVEGSHTGRFLRKVLGLEGRQESAALARA